MCGKNSCSEVFAYVRFTKKYTDLYRVIQSYTELYRLIQSYTNTIYSCTELYRKFTKLYREYTELLYIQMSIKCPTSGGQTRDQEAAVQWTFQP